MTTGCAAGGLRPANGPAASSITSLLQVPKTVTPPVSVVRWFNDTKAVQDLRQVLEEEFFQRAVATLKEIAGPSFGTLQDNDTNSLRHAWYAGYRDAFNDLSKLTKLPDTNSQKTGPTHPDQWTHIQ